MQIQLFIEVEEMLKIFIPYLKWMQCLAQCVKQLNRRAIRQWSIDLKVKPFWHKIAFLWGDEIEEITTELQRKEQVHLHVG